MAFSGAEAFDYLRRAHERGRLGHAYLVTGPEGSGKRALCEAVCALVNPAYGRGGEAAAGGDVQVVEPESKSRRIVIGQMRELERALRLTGSGSGRKVGVIREADRLQPQAANAFLKTLEEPPGSVLFLLVTSEPQALLETIISRCVPVPLKAAAGEGVDGPEQERVFALLGAYHEARQPRGPGDAFGLARRFMGLLAEARAEIQRLQDEELEAEEAHYAKTTDGSWLEGREERGKALTESEYVRHRSRFTGALVAWWAEVLRRQQGGERGHGPWEASWNRLAERLTTAQVLARIDRLDDLREHLDRNVQEGLAVEAAFLRAFAD